VRGLGYRHEHVDAENEPPKQCPRYWFWYADATCDTTLRTCKVNVLTLRGPPTTLTFDLLSALWGLRSWTGPAQVLEHLASALDSQGPLSSSYGTQKTVKARFWHWRSGKRHRKLPSCPLSVSRGMAVFLSRNAERRASVECWGRSQHSTVHSDNFKGIMSFT